MKRILLSLLVLPFISYAQQRNSHQLSWIRLALADNINDKLRCEVVYQKRTQNDYASDPNLFHSFQFQSYWLSFQYSINKNVTFAVSPFGYYRSHSLNVVEVDKDKPTTKEFRWVAQLIHEISGRYIDFSQRLTMDYRSRDINHDGHYIGNWRPRYLVRIDKDVFGLLSASKPVTFTIYDEVYFQFGEAVKNNSTVFDQNRIYGGASYEMFTNVKFSLGYFYSYQIRSSGDQSDDINMYYVALTFDNFIHQFLKPKK